MKLWFITGTLCLILVGQLRYFVPGLGFRYVELGFTAGQLFGMYLLVADGSLLKTRVMRRVLFGFTGVMVLGVAMKVMHYPFATALVSLGWAGVFCAYTVHFFRKQTKGPLDFMKWLWVVTAFVTALFVLYHWPMLLVVKDFPRLVFTLLFVMYAWQKTKNELGFGLKG